MTKQTKDYYDTFGGRYAQHYTSAHNKKERSELDPIETTLKI